MFSLKKEKKRPAYSSEVTHEYFFIKKRKEKTCLLQRRGTFSFTPNTLHVLLRERERKREGESV